MNDELPIHNNYNRHESFREPRKLTNGRRLKKRSLKLNKKSTIALNMNLKPIHKESAYDYDINDTNLLNVFYSELSLKEEEIELANSLNEAKYKDPDEYQENEDGIKCASVIQLVLILTDPNSDIFFQKQFLCCFSCFTNTKLLLALLLTRFFANEKQVESEELLEHIRNRIIRILIKWIKISASQFTENMICVLNKFLLVLEEPDQTQENQSILYLNLKDGLDILTNKKQISYPTKSLLPPILPECDEENIKSVQNYDPEEVARQLTLIHINIFKKIEPDELLKGIWNVSQETKIQHINELIDIFNKFSSYVSISVLYGESSKKRAETFNYWINVACKFEAIKNYHGLFSVIFGLQHVSVTRLSKTIKEVMKNTESKENFERLSTICDFGNDFKTYRKIISDIKGSCVPFIGCFQKDLIYIQETYPNTINGLINFKKCEACYSLLKSILDFQSSEFNFEVVPKLLNFIEELPEPAENTDMMKLSLSKEKKSK